MYELFKNSKILLLICFLILIQFFLSFTRFNEPFIDGRLHWYYDNAFFLKHAKHSNDNSYKSLQKIAGLAGYQYDIKGKVTGISNTVTHPVLSPFLFKIYTKIVGHKEWAPRTFAFGISIITTVLLFSFLFLSTQSLFASWFLTLLFILIPINTMYQDQWKYFHLTKLLIIAYLYVLSRIKKTKYHKYLLIFLFFLSFQTDWPAYIAGALSVLFLFIKRRVRDFKDLWIYLSATALVSILLNFMILFALGWNLQGLISHMQYRLHGSISQITHWGWLLKQIGFLDYNFGQINIAIFIMFAIYIIGTRTLFSNILSFSSVIVFITGFLYVIIFRNLSYIHHYTHAYLALAYILLIGGVLINIKQKIWMGKHIQFLGVSIVIPIILLTGFNSYKAITSVRQSTFGTGKDMELIKNINRRIIYLDNGLCGPAGWWSGPIITLYTDRIYRGKKRHVPATNITNVKRFRPYRDVIVTINNERYKNAAISHYRKQFGLKDLRLYKKTPTFSYFTFSK